ncbi:hypothetical protein CR513_25874, partial [Mucuna pruriens]
MFGACAACFPSVVNYASSAIPPRLVSHRIITLGKKISYCHDFAEDLKMDSNIFWFEKALVCLSYEMETKQGSVTVTLSYGALTCAAEVLATLLASAVVKATLLAPVSHSLPSSL